MQLCSSLSSQNPLPFSPLIALTQKELQYLLYTYLLYLCLYHCTRVYLYRNHSERQRVAFVSRWALTLKSGDARCLVSPSWVSTSETFPLPVIISHLYLSKRSNFSHSSSPPFTDDPVPCHRVNKNPSVDILSSLQHKSTWAYVLLPFLHAEFWKFSDHMASQEHILRTSLVV